MPSSAYIISQISGWVYTICWNASFFPQFYEIIWKNKSMTGFSLDFITLDMTGFICYVIFITVGNLQPVYRTGYISVQDMVFSYNALVCVTGYLILAFVYPIPDNVQHRSISLITILLISFPICAIIILIILGNGTGVIPLDGFVNWVIFAGYYKTFLTLCKYTPQAWSNYKRKSTKGWNIWGVLLDIVGGIMEITQMSIDTLCLGEDFSIGKVALSMVSFIYGFIFCFQHYYLYSGYKTNQILKLKKFYEETQVNYLYLF